MSSRHLQRAWEIVSEALDRPAPDQRGFVDAQCGGDAALLREVESLLEFAGRQPRAAGFGDPAQPAAPAATGARIAPAEPPPTIPSHVGDYSIVRKIGEGGMGVVYEAVQGTPHRRVALKLLRTSVQLPELQRRFSRESEVLASLQHPGIVQVHDVSAFEHLGYVQPFFAMEFVEGERLDEYVRAHELSIGQRLSLLAAICDAAHYAHQKGVLHRDLKPDNVMVTAAGLPKILDFGVARVMAIDDPAVTRVTDPGHVVGTLAYMSPEQAAGDPRDLTVASDVWSLGVIGYEMLCGELPVPTDRRNLAEVARLLADSEPVALGQRDRRLRGDVEVVVGKAMAKEPARRYQSAAEFAVDLRRILADEPVAARAPSALYQLRKFARRNRALVGGAITTVLALLLGFAFTIAFAWRASEQEERARRFAYAMGISAAVESARSGHHGRAAALLQQSPPELRGWEWRHLRSRLEPWSRRVAVATRGRVGWSADGRRLFAAGTDGAVVVVDEDDTVARPYRTDAVVTHVAVDPGSPLPLPRLAAACADAGILVWQGRAGVDDRDRAPASWRGHTQPVKALAWSSTGVLASVSGSELIVWDPRAGVPARTDAVRHVHYLQWSRDGRRLAILQIWGVRIVEPSTGTWVTYSTPKEPQACVFSADGARLFVSTLYQNIHVLDAATAERIDTNTDHVRDNHDVALSPDGRLLAMSSRVGQLELRETAGMTTTAVLPYGAGRGRLAFRPDGRALACAPVEGGLVVFDLSLESAPVAELDDTIGRLCWSADGGLLAVSTDAGQARVLDTVTWMAVASPHGRVVGFVAGERLLLGPAATATEFRTIDFVTGEVGAVDGAVVGGAAPRPYPAPASNLPPRLHGEHQRIAMRADGGAWVTMDTEGTDLLVLADGREPIAVPGAVRAALFWPRSDRLLVGDDRQCRLWQLDRERGTLHLLRATLPEVHTGVVLCVALSPDGTRIATGCRDNLVRVFDAATFELLLELRGHRSHVAGVAFSPGGDRLASVSGDRTVRIWDTEPRGRHVARRTRLLAAMRAVEPRAAQWLAELGLPGALAHAAAAPDLDDLQRLAARRLLVQRGL